MGLFNNNKEKEKVGGFMDQIRCDEPSYLIWKWHPTGSQQGNNNRENAIRYGSSLRVKDGEVAVFVYKQNDQVMQDFIEGPFDQIIETKNFPVLASIVGHAYAGGTPFQAEIYFINTAQLIQVRFGVPFFDVFDPRFQDFGVPVAVRGTISFKISDYREFVKLHRLINFDLDQFQDQVKDAVIRYVKEIVANAPAKNDIPVIQIETKTAQITDNCELLLTDRLKEDFGVVASGVDISAIEIDKSSEGYKQLMAVTKDVELATTQAKKEAQVKNIRDMQRIEAENYEETLRIQREEGQYAMHKETQSKNIAAFQVESQTQVGIAGAEALGKMGSNGAGAIGLGSGDSNGGGVGFNPAALMTGMALGGAVGQNIAGTVNGLMSGMTNQVQSGMTPPPVPQSGYNLVIDGQAAGPFTIDQLTAMAKEGSFSGESLVWKAGMADWTKAGAVAELTEVLANVMPPVPPTK